MTFATNQGVRIHFEVTGEGPPLVLMHGFTGNLQRWRLCGYEEALKKDHTLIMLDARGHGRSDKPHDPAAYAIGTRVADVVAVLDVLGIEQADYWGYSMGGRIGLGMAKYAPHRLRSLVIGASHPYPDESFAAFDTVDGMDPAAFVAALESVIGESISAAARPMLLANDLKALAAAARSHTSQDSAHTDIRLPCFLYVGTEDARHAAVERCASEIPGAQFAAIPGVNHVTGFVRSKLVLPRVLQFLSQRLRTDHQ